jgi:hypothetical protein
MGAWGTALFSDDTACDVRDTWLDLIGDGLSGPDATAKVLHEWSTSLHDPDVAPVFWLSLAATQWKYGRLEPHVRQQALNIIDSGSDLARWQHPSADFKKRKLVLEKLRDQLISPQPKQKRITKPFRDSNEWGVGDLIAYRLSSGRLVILRIIGHHSDKGGTSPVCELLDWSGEQLPQSFDSLGVSKGHGIKPITQFFIGRTSTKERPDSRLQHLGVNTSPSQTPKGYTAFLWRWFDKSLKDHFGLE